MFPTPSWSERKYTRLPIQQGLAILLLRSSRRLKIPLPSASHHLFGVSSFQLQFGSQRVYTPGDRLDCLVAMNPAALKVHLRDLKPGGLLIVNTAAFEKRNLDKAGYP